ncbi:hypothetical protein [Rubrivivax benzoatilyticus]|uniref:Uncharacterized protein n=1 Tax=Rubrivivax benzoatilyticus TaxID=316997 RepID=A0ABX0HUB3_9BURK|nr:hypothetical protein [Rubrivivax benzoatilyticus]NHK98602.1 hypothetical protein [Rubrivivax benzoatilyticus]NHL24104.1 hypothetical protein [Rubrivivax benzoatilyticus]
MERCGYAVPILGLFSYATAIGASLSLGSAWPFIHPADLAAHNTNQDGIYLLAYILDGILDVVVVEMAVEGWFCVLSAMASIY